MKVFRVNRNIEIVCQSESTRYGFRHLATLIINGDERETDKACYYNRTWERYEFESVLESLKAKAYKNGVITVWQKRQFEKMIASGDRVRDDLKPLKALSAVMAMGDILAKDTAGANDWKERMLKAGLENKGLIMPADWDTLSESDKEARLNGAIAALK